MSQYSVVLWAFACALLGCQSAAPPEPTTNRCAGCCPAPLENAHAPACEPVPGSSATLVDRKTSIQSAPTVSTLGSKRLIGVLGFDSVLASDVTAPLEVFGAAGTKAWFSDYQVALVADAPQGVVTTAEGFRLVVDAQLTQVPGVDVLIVPGSYQMSNVIRQQSVLQFVKLQRQKAKWLASNCAGAFLLGAAGALDGRRATTYHGGGKALKAEVPGAVVVDQSVVVDGRLVTSNGSAVSYVSALVLLGLISSPEHAREIFDYLQLSQLISWDTIQTHLP